MQLHEGLVEAVRVAVRGEISSALISVDTHNEHHDYISGWIAEQQRKQVWREKVKASVGGWLIVTVLGGIGTATWQAANYLKEHFRWL